MASRRSKRASSSSSSSSYGESGHIIAFKAPVDVNHALQATIFAMVEGLSEIQGAIKNYIQTVIRGGLNIDIKSKGFSFKIEGDMEKDVDEETKEYYHQDLLPSVEKMLYQFIVFGFCCIKMAYSKVREGWPSIQVIDHRYVNIKIILNKELDHEYKVYLNPSVSTMLGAFTQQEYKEALFLSVYPPDPVTGDLTSPLSRKYETMVQLKHLWDCKISAESQLSNPVIIFSQQEPKSLSNATSSSLDTLENNGLFIRPQVASDTGLTQAIDDACVDGAKIQQYRQEQSLRHREEMLRTTPVYSSMMQFPGIQRQVADHHPAAVHLESIAKRDPIRNMYTATLGQKVERPPEARPPSEFNETNQNLLRQLYNTIGQPLPASFYANGKFSAGEILSQITAEYQHSICNTQKITNKPITDAFKFVIQKAAEREEVSSSDGENSQSDEYHDPYEEYDEEQNVKKKQQRDERKSKREREFPVQHVLGEFGFNESDSESEGEEVDEEIKVVVEYVFSPIITSEAANMLMDRGLLDPTEYQKMMLHINGLPQSAGDPGFVEHHEWEVKTEKEAAEAGVKDALMKNKDKGSSSSQKAAKKPRTK